MKVPFVDVRSQYNDVREETDAVLHEILSTGGYVLGKHNKGLEEEIAALHGVKHGIAVNSGTDALRIMLDATGVGKGDEVITTAFTFVASVEVIVQAGAVPVFVDIDPATFQIDADRDRGRDHACARRRSCRSIFSGSSSTSTPSRRLPKDTT